MKKLIFLGSAITSFLTPVQVWAQSPTPNTINIEKPDVGFKSMGDFISNALTIAFAIAVLIVLVMLIQGAFEWITSGGDKEAVGKARNRIINALIGLAVLAVAFALANIFAQFTGLNLGNLAIPTPNPSPSGL